MAAGHGTGPRMRSALRAVSAKRCIDRQSDSARGRFSAREHCGGKWQVLAHGLRPAPFNREWESQGTRVTPAFRGASVLPGRGSCERSCARPIGWPAARWFGSQPSTAIRCEGENELGQQWLKAPIGRFIRSHSLPPFPRSWFAAPSNLYPLQFSAVLVTRPESRTPIAPAPL